MWRHSISLLLLLTHAPLLFATPPPRPVVHDLRVMLQPDRGGIEVEDLITLPTLTKGTSFILNAKLQPTAVDEDVELRATKEYRGAVDGVYFRAEFATPRRSFTLRYRGSIVDPVAANERGMAGDRSRGTAGTISAEGVYLSGSTLWYPLIPPHSLAFRLHVQLPDGWQAISQGEALKQESAWREQSPQDEIYLIAGRYHLYRTQSAGIEARVYLREADQALAQRYLLATARYLDLYQRLLGSYPYQKFAMVENFWESGYGMPSFTLLGPRVLRFPFILNSSYPHEILHNWWGNGVYVDYASGNWSEGLTSYLADHLIREREGRGDEYRRDTLQRYADFVDHGNDFPLSGFRGRHGDASQAVGYGKSLMMFHALRLRLGDRLFLDGLRRFYRDHLFRSAGYEDLRAAFEAVSGTDLGPLFRQWTQRRGAPALALTEVEVVPETSGYRLNGSVRQTQQEAPFELSLPLAVQLRSGAFFETRLAMNARELDFTILLDEQPLRLSVDPRFDLFRQLAAGETPSSLGQLFGDRSMTIVLPAEAETRELEALTTVAEAWSRRWQDLRVIRDDRITALPSDRSVWLFGLRNRFAASLLAQLAEDQMALSADQLHIAERSLATAEHSFALTAAHPQQPQHAIALLNLASAEAANGLARKLPHYGKYSYTVFSGNEPTILLKGQWPTNRSALSVDLTPTDNAEPLPLPARTPLEAAIGG
ncbi:MAG: M1 family peptidase [Gammaproteobacteria bacterium]|nr:M1 family peptidase [Gammaproteobacteria bacterium]